MDTVDVDEDEGEDVNVDAIVVTFENANLRHGVLGSPQLVRTVECRLSDETSDHVISDITILTVDGVETIVVTETTNKCMKSVYNRNKRPCYFKLPLDSGPCGIAHFLEKQVIVAVPESHQLVRVEVTPDLAQLSIIRTYKKYSSLAVLGSSSIAAGCLHPGCVDILNMEGELTKSLSTHSNTGLFSPSYMCINNKGDLLVSDSEKKTVICVTTEGDVLWKYGPAGDPRGIRCTTEGVLFVDVAFHKVIQLTQAGQYVRDVLNIRDGIWCPMGLFVDKHRALFVTRYSQIKEFQFV